MVQHIDVYRSRFRTKLDQAARSQGKPQYLPLLLAAALLHTIRNHPANTASGAQSTSPSAEKLHGMVNESLKLAAECRKQGDSQGAVQQQAEALRYLWSAVAACDSSFPRCGSRPGTSPGAGRAIPAAVSSAAPTPGAVTRLKDALVAREPAFAALDYELDADAAILTVRGSLGSHYLRQLLTEQVLLQPEVRGVRNLVIVRKRR